MVLDRSLCQDANRSYSLGELQIGGLKLKEVPLELELDHLGRPIEVSLECFSLGHLVKKMVKVC